jgi:apolipoprotein N-acyltransferase
MITLICAVLSGGMFYLAYGLDDVWQLAWIAPLPLLWLAYGDAPRWQIVAAGFFASAMGTIYFFQAYGTYVLIDGIVILIVNGLLLAATVLLSGIAYRSLGAVASLLAFPALWTTGEFLESLISPHGAWGSIGYSQVDWPAAIQLASITGVYGVTFILCLFANTAALMLRGKRRVAGLGVALTIAVIAGGYARLATPLRDTLRVAALADVTAKESSDTDLDIGQRYAAAIRSEAAKGVKVFVTPETGLGTNGLVPVEAASQVTGTLVVAGVHNRAPERNMAVALVSGKKLLTYDKRHRLLPEEGKYSPGTRSGYIADGMATAICKDLDFPHTIRSDAHAGIRLMMVPANDFYLDDWIHARQAVMRGVENGFAVLRTASHGLAMVSDDRGRILALAKVRQPGFVVARADAPLGSGPTLYTRLGDWFAWCCVILAIALVGLSLFARRRAPKMTAVARQLNASVLP